MPALYKETQSYPINANSMYSFCGSAIKGVGVSITDMDHNMGIILAARSFKALTLINGMTDVTQIFTVDITPVDSTESMVNVSCKYEFIMHQTDIFKRNQKLVKEYFIVLDSIVGRASVVRED